CAGRSGQHRVDVRCRHFVDTRRRVENFRRHARARRQANRHSHRWTGCDRSDSPEPDQHRRRDQRRLHQSRSGADRLWDSGPIACSCRPAFALARFGDASWSEAADGDRSNIMGFFPKEPLMPDVAERADVLTLDNFISGRWIKASATEFFDVHNPALGSVIGRTPLSTAADVDAAVRAATQAFPAWRDTPVNARAQVLYKFKEPREPHVDELARTVTTEHGKTLDEARGSVRRGIECVEVGCGAPSLMQGFGLEDIAAGIDCHVVRQPLGVVAAIAPFNFPAMVP